MRKFLLKTARKTLQLLYGEDKYIMFFLADELGRMAEGRLFTEGEKLSHIMIDTFHGDYFLDIVPEVEETEEANNDLSEA